MQVILTKDVETLGESGQVLTVADGYARNYLLPYKMAVVASKGSLKDLEGRIRRIRAKAEKKHQADLAQAEQLNALGELVFEANAGESGKLFGAITTKELAKVLQDKTGQVIDRKLLILSHPINQLGDYTLTIKLSTRVSATVAIKVTLAAE